MPDIPQDPGMPGLDVRIVRRMGKRSELFRVGLVVLVVMAVNLYIQSIVNKVTRKMSNFNYTPIPSYLD